MSLRPRRDAPPSRRRTPSPELLMTDLSPDDAVVEKLRALRAAQLELIWPAAEAAAESADHAPLVELIKVYTAIQAIDFALLHRPDPNAATRTQPGFRRPGA